MQLHCADQQETYRRSRERFNDQKLDVDSVGSIQFNLEWQYQMVALMLLRPDAQDHEAKLFTDANEVRRELTPNETTWFIDQHTLMQQEEMKDWAGIDDLPSWAYRLAELLDLEDPNGDQIVDAVEKLKND
jgi:hypothetical protein